MAHLLRRGRKSLLILLTESSTSEDFLLTVIRVTGGKNEVNMIWSRASANLKVEREPSKYTRDRVGMPCEILSSVCA